MLDLIPGSTKTCIGDDNEVNEMWICSKFEPEWFYFEFILIKILFTEFVVTINNNTANYSSDNNGLVQCLHVCRTGLKTNPAWTDKYFSVCFSCKIIIKMQIIQCEEKSKQTAFDTEVRYILIYTLVQDKIKSNQIKIEYNKTILRRFLCVWLAIYMPRYNVF